MALDLANYQVMAKAAVKSFWGNREAAREKQAASGKADQGERAGVTAGKNMKAFLRWWSRLSGATVWIVRRSSYKVAW